MFDSIYANAITLKHFERKRSFEDRYEFKEHENHINVQKLFLLKAIWFNQYVRWYLC